MLRGDVQIKAHDGDNEDSVTTESMEKDDAPLETSLVGTCKVCKKPVTHICSCFSTISITCSNIQNLQSVFNQSSVKVIDFGETSKAVFIYPLHLLPPLPGVKFTIKIH